VVADRKYGNYRFVKALREEAAGVLVRLRRWDHLPDFPLGQNCGQAPGPLGPHQFGEQILICAQYLATKEAQRAEGLIPGRSSRVLFTCQGGEKSADSFLQTMSFVVTEDQALGPIGVGFLRAVGIVLALYCIVFLIEQFLGLPRFAGLRQSRFAYRAES